MLTIGQLAAYAGVTVRAVRHYHQVGLLPEPERDASGYRRGGTARRRSCPSSGSAPSPTPVCRCPGSSGCSTGTRRRSPQRSGTSTAGCATRSGGPEIFETDTGDDDPRLEEAADILAGLAEQAYTSGEGAVGEDAHDDLELDLLDALAVESDPRTKRLQRLVRERGWPGWNRLERLADPPV